jgi:hypothetical protein
MNKDLKLLLISIFGMFLVTVLLYVTNNYNCGQMEYQTLKGTQYQLRCEKKPDPNCWNNYKTENEAIMACEGKQ